MQSEQITQEILSRIDVLASKLGVAGGELWKVLCNQPIVEAYNYSLWAILLFIGALVTFLLGRKLFKISKDGEDGFIPVWIISAVLAIAMLVNAFNATQNFVIAKYNPQFYAVRQIKELLK